MSDPAAFAMCFAAAAVVAAVRWTPHIKLLREMERTDRQLREAIRAHWEAK